MTDKVARVSMICPKSRIPELIIFSFVVDNILYDILPEEYILTVTRGGVE
jgi:hypothetical protein